MQDFYNKIRQSYTSESEASQFFLRPEQIQSKIATKSRHNTNSIIRLAESIKKYGVIKPVLVKKQGAETGFEGYEVVDGEQRLRAAILAGVAKIPCMLLAQDDKSHALTGILAHLQGKELNMFEQAAGFRLLMQDFAMTQAEIAHKLGVSQSSIANKLRLLGLSHEEQRTVLAHSLTERHARSILRLKQPETRALALRTIYEERLNVAQTEEMIEALLNETPREMPEKGQESAILTPKGGRGVANPHAQQAKSGLQGSQTPMPPIASPSAQNAACFTVISPQTPPKGCIPRKFAIPDLTPLYNSIERTLSIFRKTGATVSCMREESDDGVRIVIKVPKNA